MKIFIQLILLLIRGVATVEKTIFFKFSGQETHYTFLILSVRPSWSDYCLLISYWQVWLLWSPAWACREAFSWPFRASGVRLSWCFLLWGRLFRNLCCLCLLLLFVVLRNKIIIELCTEHTYDFSTQVSSLGAARGSVEVGPVGFVLIFLIVYIFVSFASAYYGLMSKVLAK